MHVLQVYVSSLLQNNLNLMTVQSESSRVMTNTISFTVGTFQTVFIIPIMHCYIVAL